mmetsp:Transcript_26901/g.75618  ORF Transcript_26901/g.75618 Transcript_26901/m.75618 type:complete len:239 (+) Transcript_26901:361-1077(+)
MVAKRLRRSCRLAIRQRGRTDEAHPVLHLRQEHVLLTSVVLHHMAQMVLDHHSDAEADLDLGGTGPVARDHEHANLRHVMVVVIIMIVVVVITVQCCNQGLGIGLADVGLADIVAIANGHKHEIGLGLLDGMTEVGWAAGVALDDRGALVLRGGLELLRTAAECVDVDIIDIVAVIGGGVCGDGVDELDSHATGGADHEDVADGDHGSAACVCHDVAVDIVGIDEIVGTDADIDEICW